MLPGSQDPHWPWVVCIAAGCLIWGLYTLRLPHPERKGPLFWHVPATASLGVTAAAMAATGGVESPARFYLFFLLVYAAYFFPRRQALPYLAGCVLVALAPLAYDDGAFSQGYVAELVVLCPAYVLLGLLIINGKALLVRLRDQARILSLRDPLTDLPNRRAMLEWLAAEIAEGAQTGLILADLDGFKNVNTAHGHPAGDAVLREAARRLSGAVRTDDVVARLGGDEFAVLVPRAHPEVMRMLAGRVLDVLRELDYEEIRLTASVGWVLHPEDAASVNELIAAADLCMRAAKLSGKDRALSASDWVPDDELAA